MPKEEKEDKAPVNVVVRVLSRNRGRGRGCGEALPKCRSEARRALGD